MPQASREIHRRIKSIRSTRKVTKAMEMVAGAKMRKAQGVVLGSRPYSVTAWGMMMHVAGKVGKHTHPFFGGERTRTAGGLAKNTLIVLVASDKGLCGSLNVQVCGKVLEFIGKRTSSKPASPKHEQGEPIRTLRGGGMSSYEFITVGKKARDAVQRIQGTIIAEFTNMGSVVSSVEMRPLVKIILTDFLAGRYEAVYVAYTDFISTLKQVPRIKKILPLEPEMDTELGSVGSNSEPQMQHLKEQYEFLFEPSPEFVLNTILAKLVGVQIFQAVLESNASEHSARMIAMKNASDAAGDMLSDLTLEYNQARQAGITQEIAEIATAAVAMGGG